MLTVVRFVPVTHDHLPAVLLTLSNDEHVIVPGIQAQAIVQTAEYQANVLRREAAERRYGK